MRTSYFNKNVKRSKPIQEVNKKYQQELNISIRIVLAGEDGLKISRSKTEYRFCDDDSLSNIGPIALDDVLLPVCSVFWYLGSLVQSFKVMAK